MSVRQRKRRDDTDKNIRDLSDERERYDNRVSMDTGDSERRSRTTKRERCRLCHCECHWRPSVGWFGCMYNRSVCDLLQVPIARLSFFLQRVAADGKHMDIFVRMSTFGLKMRYLRKV